MVGNARRLVRLAYGGKEISLGCADNKSGAFAKRNEMDGGLPWSLCGIA